MAKSIDIEELYQLLELKFGIVGRSEVMAVPLKLLIQAAPTDLTILITGETGTGKEVFANAIHGLSNRKKYPLISVNCAAIPETLLESELFGHEKGAFTGAIDQRKGFFEVANQGTIFLDEIGEMPIGTQVKLLRILESGEFSRLGSSSVHKVNVRVIAATNRNLEDEVRQKNFRQDLFFRLNSVNIILPPLRKHLEDIPHYVDYFANRVSNKLGLKYDGIANESISILKSQHWAGNIRELKNLIETLVTLEQTTFITPEILRRYIAPALPPFLNDSLPDDKSMVHIRPRNEDSFYELGLILKTLFSIQNEIHDLKNQVDRQYDVLEEIKFNTINPIIEQKNDGFNINNSDNNDDLNLENMEKNLIQMALKKYYGNRKQAADALGISERTLYRKLKDYDLD